MASSKVMSRICSRQQPLSLKLSNKKTSFFLSWHFTHQIQLSVSSSSLFKITGGIEQFGNNDAFAQCDSFSSLAIELVNRVSELVFSSSRHLNAFMTASSWRFGYADSFSGIGM